MSGLPGGPVTLSPAQLLHDANGVRTIIPDEWWCLYMQPVVRLGSYGMPSSGPGISSSFHNVATVLPAATPAIRKLRKLSIVADEDLGGED